MTDAPMMKPRELKDRSGWYVQLVWPNGSEQQVNGFATELEAQAWIDDDSAAWIKKAMEPRT